MPKKLKIETRSVQHVFDAAEIAQNNIKFRQAFADVRARELELKSVTTTYKAKVAEAEGRMETLNAILQAGFEQRDKPCVVVYDVAAGKKHYFVATPTGEYPPDAKPEITEDMTQEDYNQELIDAESVFEKLESVEIFTPAGNDTGTLKIGRQNGKWFTALTVTIGRDSLIERLDGEQPACKKRADAVRRGLGRFIDWVESKLGKESAKGFVDAANLESVNHAEREE